MPTPVRPSDNLDWVGTQVQPTAPEKTTGFVPNFRPPAEWHNWMFGIIDAWIKWLDYTTQIDYANREFDAVVGTGGSHATINLLMADPNIANIKNVLISTTQTLTATQVIDHAGMTFYFKPQAEYVKSGAVTPAISIQADRTTIYGGRVMAFNGVSDKGIQIESGFKNCLISGVRFNDCTTAINDLGTGNTLSDNIEEV